MALPYRVLATKQPNPVMARNRSVRCCSVLLSHLLMKHEPAAHKTEPKVRGGAKGPEARIQGGEKHWDPWCSESDTTTFLRIWSEENLLNSPLEADQQAVSSRYYPITGLKRDASACLVLTVDTSKKLTLENGANSPCAGSI